MCSGADDRCEGFVVQLNPCQKSRSRKRARLFLFLEGNNKLGSGRQRLDGQLPIVRQRYFLADRQAQAGAVMLSIGRTPKTLKQKWQMVRVDAGSLVLNTDCFFVDGNNDGPVRRRRVDRVLNNVFQQDEKRAP